MAPDPRLPGDPSMGRRERSMRGRDARLGGIIDRRLQRRRVERAVACGEAVGQSQDAPLAVDMAMDWQEHPIRSAWPLVVCSAFLGLIGVSLTAAGRGLNWWLLLVVTVVASVGVVGYIDLQRRRAVAAEAANREVCAEAGLAAPDPRDPA